MFRIPATMNAYVRNFSESGWQDCAPLRWFAQLLVGGLPGVAICLVIRWMAGAPTEQGSGAHIASMIPLLSASGLADSPAFHRLKFEPSVAASRAPQFRTPDVNKLPTKTAMVPPTTAASVDFNAPRTAWKHLSPAVRAQIDASLALRRDWQGMVLHGSRSSHGNAKLLDRYDASVRGMSQGLAYHFVIGNGSGAQDGLVETGSRWAQAAPGADTAGNISVCLVGDFNEQAPSKAQLEAIDELMDYLSIKLGKLELAHHRSADGSLSSCLGIKFPAASLTK